MELSERLGQVKYIAKEEELPEYTPDDVVYLFGDVDVAQPIKKGFIKTTMPVTLPPFSHNNH